MWNPDSLTNSTDTIQLTLLKEHYIPSFAKRFQAAGYACLIYDHRGWGSSEGEPRNQVDPLQQAEDYHDAVVFAASLPDIDPKRVCIWGIGHSGGACMIAAGDDPNVKAVILVMPFTSGKADAMNFVPGSLAMAWEARKEKCLSTSKRDDAFIQPWDESEEEANGDRNSILLHGPVPYEFRTGAKELSDEAGTPWQNRLSLRSLYYISRSEPRDHIHKISPKPLLHLAAVEDVLSGPPEAQKEVFARAGEPKEFVLLEHHHIANYFEGFEANIGAQLKFLEKYL